MTTDYFNPVSYSPFLHFWSLGVEEQFYFVWPALLAVVAWKTAAPRRRPSPSRDRGRASFIASVIVTETSPSTAFYMLPTRAWQLAAGGLLAVGAGSLDRLPGRDPGASFASCSPSPVGRPLAALITAAFVINSTDDALPGHRGARADPRRRPAHRLRPRADRPRRAAAAAADPVPGQDQLLALPVALADADPGRPLPGRPARDPVAASRPSPWPAFDSCRDRELVLRRGAVPSRRHPAAAAEPDSGGRRRGHAGGRLSSARASTSGRRPQLANLDGISDGHAVSDGAGDAATEPPTASPTPTSSASQTPAPASHRRRSRR